MSRLIFPPISNLLQQEDPLPVSTPEPERIPSVPVTVAGVLQECKDRFLSCFALIHTPTGTSLSFKLAGQLALTSNSINVSAGTLSLGALKVTLRTLAEWVIRMVSFFICLFDAIVECLRDIEDKILSRLGVLEKIVRDLLKLVEKIDDLVSVKLLRAVDDLDRAVSDLQRFVALFSESTARKIQDLREETTLKIGKEIRDFREDTLRRFEEILLTVQFLIKDAVRPIEEVLGPLREIQLRLGQLVFTSIEEPGLIARGTIERTFFRYGAVALTQMANSGAEPGPPVDLARLLPVADPDVGPFPEDLREELDRALSFEDPLEAELDFVVAQLERGEIAAMTEEFPDIDALLGPSNERELEGAL